MKEERTEQHDRLEYSCFSYNSGPVWEEARPEGWLGGVSSGHAAPPCGLLTVIKPPMKLIKRSCLPENAAATKAARRHDTADGDMAGTRAASRYKSSHHAELRDQHHSGLPQT